MTAALIPLIISSISELSKLFHKTVEAAKQNAELTPQQEAEFQAKFQAALIKPEWQPSHLFPK
jgi:hypothetical protein